LEFKLPVKFIG